MVFMPRMTMASDYNIQVDLVIIKNRSVTIVIQANKFVNSEKLNEIAKKTDCTYLKSPAITPLGLVSGS